MKKQVTNTEIRKAIAEKNIENLYKFAKTRNISVYDLINDSKAASSLKSEARWAVELAKHSNRRKLAERDRNLSVPSLFELKHNIIAYLKEQISKPISNNSKAAMCGITHLYFCSPIYGHSDYNKWCTLLPIQGNEAFVHKIISISNKYFFKQ